ncbi:MAG: hydrogenase maturation peptidase HycI [Candidatus Nezhaarchaeota archaeon]|nr:hydrogenase maturation peptidase HycI [Candidatus Nezhaarchaeota archaeon]MCX8141715.1 hydrogenase maturation peptidase HycI [Candidatus Nezhaarchaeota archaeon]MDW8049982.1 hydrogenase maturation peptidase HycI [Nitrososphaerota archaeon]
MWREIARRLIEEIGREERPSVVVLCIGNEERGDDGLGPCIAKKIKDLNGKGPVKVIDGGTVPENYTGVIRKLRPTHVIIVDAVNFGGRPGDIIMSLEPRFSEVSISTHHPSLLMLTKYIERSVGSKVILLGAQPKALDLGSKMTQEVLMASDVIIKALRSALKKLQKVEEKV